MLVCARQKHVLVLCIQHYITEKVYDALLAGAEPLYFGAPNLVTSGYVSAECVLQLADLTPVHYNTSTRRLEFDTDVVSQRFVHVLCNIMIHA